MTLFERIKLLCKERKTSPRQLSIDCGFSASTINKWKDHSPTYEKIQIVADHLGVDADWLAGTSDVQKNEQIVYYTDNGTVIKAQDLSDGQRAVMKAVPTLKPQQVDAILSIITQFKGTNPDG